MKSIIKTKKLCSYMKKRSKVEGVTWSLPKEKLDILFDTGIRMFFGVVVDNNGNLLYDTQEPYFGFFITHNLNDLFKVQNMSMNYLNERKRYYRSKYPKIEEELVINLHNKDEHIEFLKEKIKYLETELQLLKIKIKEDDKQCKKQFRN